MNIFDGIPRSTIGEDVEDWFNELYFDFRSSTYPAKLKSVFDFESTSVGDVDGEKIF